MAVVPMRHDMELVRQILIKVTESDSNGWKSGPFDEYSEAEVGYNTKLLVDAGLLSGNNVTSADSVDSVYEFIGCRLTWTGNDFLDDASDDTVWKKARERASNASFDVFKAVLSEVAKAAAGL